MAEWVEFNDINQRARVAAGYKGGDQFAKPVLAPKRHFTEALSLKSQVMQGFQSDSTGNVTDPWYSRKQGK